jgi:hypothetical protein
MNLSSRKTGIALITLAIDLLAYLAMRPADLKERLQPEKQISGFLTKVRPYLNPEEVQAFEQEELLA